LPPDKVVLAHHLSLPVLAAVLERCRVFVGHDSGVSHLAAATGISCVLLFGPTDPAVWAPVNPAVKVVAAPEGDLGRLLPSVVQEAVRQALDQR
jgi:heptosyltransferase-2